MTLAPWCEVWQVACDLSWALHDLTDECPFPQAALRDVAALALWKQIDLSAPFGLVEIVQDFDDDLLRKLLSVTSGLFEEHAKVFTRYSIPVHPPSVVLGVDSYVVGTDRLNDLPKQRLPTLGQAVEVRRFRRQAEPP